MIATIGNIPVFNALVTDAETGMMRISLVDDPAVMSNFMAFDADKRPMMYAVQDEEKRLVRGVVMRADFPIYRRDDVDGEFYVIYKADAIRVMAEKYLAESRQNIVNLMHQDGTDVEGVQMVQYFIKGNGIQVDGYDDCADGSLFAEFHVTNDDIWASIKAGTYKGFSLEGVFELVPETDVDEVKEIVDVLHGAFSRIHTHYKSNMSKLARIKAELAKIFAEFGNVTTDKGILAWDGDDDLAVGMAVSIEDEEGNRTPAEDGDYTTDTNIIVVADGKVAAINDKDTPADAEDAAPSSDVEIAAEDASEDSADAVTEDTTEDEKDAYIKELEAKVAALEAENAELKAQIAQMQKMSAAKPAHTEVQTTFASQKTGIKGLDNLSRILNAK